MTAADDRDEIGDFIAEWTGVLTPGQGRSDLAKLVREGRLEKRVDYARQRPANKYGGSGPTVEYRATGAP